MKKFLLALTVTACCFFCNAQQQDIIKLQQQIAAHPQADTFRVNRLVEYTYKASALSPAQLDSIVNEVAALSQKLNYPEGKAYGLLGKSNTLSRTGKMAESIALKEQALRIAETLKDKTCLVRTYLSIGSIKVLRGDSKDGLAYYMMAEPVAVATHNKLLLAQVQGNIASTYQNSFGDVARAMEWNLKALQNAEEIKSLAAQAQGWSNMAGIYTAMGDKQKALDYYKKALEANKQLGNKFLEFTLLNRIGEMYRLQDKYPEAIKAYKEGLSKTKSAYNIELTQSNMADVYVRLGDMPMAFKFGFMSLEGAKSIGDLEGEEWIEGILARAYLKLNKPDSALYYAHSGYDKAVKSGTIEFKRDNSEALANAYDKKNDYSNAFKFYKLFVSYRDSMSGAEFTNQANVMAFNYDLAKKQAQITVLNQDKKAQSYFLIAAAIVIGLVVVTVIVLLGNNRQKQKANVLLSKQKQIIEEQRDRTNKALDELQHTQNQLIQSEKMASLGELTAGIAHEIQNPLNFVNNFSEVSMELLDEMEQEFRNGDREDAFAIAADVKQNLEKIRHHGKRADSIVKGMLQHSRAGSDTQEPTDINNLADEYLRLAYHGLRAKDKGFNAELVTRFDQKLPQIKIVPQDIGRVLLNLFTNAFYATQQKQKTAGAAYKPTVELITALKGRMVEIRVRDNGVGIPDNIREKIMQPFFTTKPTGEGTGLGLSLSYDILVKAHNGKIEINSEVGSFTEFIISIPL